MQHFVLRFFFFFFLGQSKKDEHLSTKMRQIKWSHHGNTEQVCHLLLAILVAIAVLKYRHHAWNGLQ